MKPTYTLFNARITSQREAIPFRESEMISNSAGGVGFKLDSWQLFDRFLIMGTEGGTYYVKEAALTKENALNTIACIHADGVRAVNRIVDVSRRGLSPKNDPALFALALAASAQSPETRTRALVALPKVARIPTHLFHFITFVRQFRGMGRGLKTALGRWYQDRDVEALAFHVLKYQGRDGFSNRDVLRLTHPKTTDPVRNTLYKWITDGAGSFDEGNKWDLIPPIIAAFEQAKSCTSPIEIARIIRDTRLPREAIPTQFLTDPVVWEALLEQMPPTALLRNLGNMSKVGLLKPFSHASQVVVEKLGNRDAFCKGKVHPISILIALKQYGLGRGLQGAGYWTPVPAVLDALDQTFYNSFDDITPTGKAILLAVDMSGSMMGSGWKGWQNDYTKDIAGTNLHPCEACAALSLAIAKRESNYYVMGFADQFKTLGITPRMSIGEAMQRCLASTFGRTDCAVPAIWAKDNKIEVDAFVVLTDNETYQGKVHPSQALRQYRESSGKNAKEVVVAMVPRPFSIADPKDLGMLDIAGFSGEVPTVINQFISGGL